MRAIVRSLRYDQPPAWVIRGLARAARAATRGRARPADAPRRLLVVRNDQLGDNILTVPLLRALRRELPTATIGLLTSPLAAEMFRTCPCIDELYVQPRRPVFQPMVRLAQVCAMSRDVFGGARFDTAVLPRWDQDADGGVLMAYFSGASRRIGFTTCVNRAEHPRNRGLHRFLTTAIDDSAVRHELLRTLEVARPLGVSVDDTSLELWPTDDDARWAAAFRERLRVPPDTGIVAVGIGGADPRRIWRRERVVALARVLAHQRPRTFLIIGGDAERDEGAAIAAAIGSAAVNLCGAVTLNQLACLFRSVRLYVGNDTGIMHLAAAADVPCVVVSCHPHGAPASHSNAPERFHPWGVPYRYARPAPVTQGCADGCRESHAHCILNVGVEIVAALANEIDAAPVAMRLTAS